MDMMSLRRRVLVNQNKLVSASGNPLTFNTQLTKPLKECMVRFTPQQEGEGTPSPDNVRNIVGWNGMTVYKAGKNVVNIVGFSAQNVNSPTATRRTTNNYGTTLSTTDPASSLVITQSEAPNEQPYNYHNGYFVIIDDNMVFGQTYSLSFRVTDIISNPLNASLSDLRIINPRGNTQGVHVIGDKIYAAIQYTQNTSNPERHGIEVRNCGMSCTISEIMVTPATDEDITYEPYEGNEITLSWDDAPQDVDPSEVAGTIYGGYLDIAKGEIVAEWYSVPTSAWTTYKQNNGYICYKATHSPGTILGGTWFSNVISEYGSFSSSAMNKNIIQKNNGSDGGTIYMALDENVDISTVQVVYPISTPIHYSLTPQSIATLRGENVMWSDANGDITVRYWTR